MFSISYLNEFLSFNGNVGFLEEIIERKRRKELGRINREIEELKRRGPDFHPSPDDRSSSSSDGGSSSHFRSGFTGVSSKYLVGALIIILLALFWYDQMRVDSLGDKVTEAEQRTTSLQEQLDTALGQLNETKDMLLHKEQKERNLSSQYLDVQQEILDLKKEILNLNSTVKMKEDSINDLTTKISDKDGIIKDLKNCIKNDSITDKEDCL